VITVILAKLVPEKAGSGDPGFSKSSGPRIKSGVTMCHEL